MERLLSKHPLIVLVLLWFLFIAWPFGNRGLWAPDEPRYLQVAWEMSKAESYLIPIMNGEIYAEKPPLYFWLTILFSKVVSFETASRWVSATASLGIILLTYLLGCISGNRKIGFTAALILMTCSLFTLLMANGNIDTTLTLFTTLSLVFFVKWDREGKSAHLVLAYVACGIGILAKGPVALIVPWLAYIAWEVMKYFRKETGAFKHLLWGPLIALAVAGLWVVPACIVGGEEYTHTILFKQQAGRAIQAYVHQRPWFDYLIAFPPNALPWFVVLLGAVPVIKKLVNAKNRMVWFYVIWFCTVFIFFSLISSKRERYLLPAYPVFSLLLSYSLAYWSDHNKVSRSIQFAGILTFIGVVGLLLFPVLLPYLKEIYPQLSIFRAAINDWRLLALYGMGIIAAVILVKGLGAARKRDHLFAGDLIALAFLFIWAMMQVYYFHYIEPVKSARLASESIKTMLPEDGTVAFYRKRYDNGWNFYLNRAKIPIIRNEDIQQRQPQYDVIILRNKHLNLLKAVLNMENYTVGDIVPVGSKNFVLLKYRGDAGG